MHIYTQIYVYANIYVCINTHTYLYVCVCMHACMPAKSLHCVQLCATLWIVAHQAPLSMGFSRHEYQSGLPCPPPGDLPDPGVKPMSPYLLYCKQILYH